MKIWKLSPMDMQSYTRWDDYTRSARRYVRGDTCNGEPVYVVDSNDQRRARLNCIAHCVGDPLRGSAARGCEDP